MEKTTTDASPATAGNQNLLAVVAYLGGFVTGIILLLLEKKNSYVRFHAMQSTIFSLGLFILAFGLGSLSVFGGWLNLVVQLGGFIVWVFLLWKAFSGEKYKLPYIGEMAEKQLAKMG